MQQSESSKSGRKPLINLENETENDLPGVSASAESSTNSSDPAEIAISLYREAGILERRGQLNDAVKKYQRAFKLYPDIESLIKDLPSDEKEQVLTGTREDLPYVPYKGISKESHEYFPHDEDSLEEMRDQLRRMQVRCEPTEAAMRRGKTHISALPTELFINQILRKLAVMDPASLEAFGMTCKAYYLLSRDPSVWRFVHEHFQRVFGFDGQSAQPLPSPLIDYRRTFIESPRLRTEGLYISQCHYLRQGFVEDAFNQPFHVVTYYRYLRFFRNGTVWSLLSTAEPALAVTWMKRSAHTTIDKKHQLLKGSYHFTDPQKLSLVTYRKDKTKTTSFHSELSLKSTYRGGWNKLSWLSYYSVANGESMPYPLTNFKAYFFSRVKSYLFD